MAKILGRSEVAIRVKLKRETPKIVKDSGIDTSKPNPAWVDEHVADTNAYLLEDIKAPGGPNKWTQSEIIIALHLRAKGKTHVEIGKELGRSATAVRVKLKRPGHTYSLPKTTNEDTGKPNPAYVDAPYEVNTLGFTTETFGGKPPADPLQEAAKKVVLEFGRIPLEVFDGGDWTRFGLVSDTHLCCKEERLDALHAQYDLFAAQGITTVFHAGNIVDGYVARINGGSVFETTIDGQAQYAVDNYPARPGITTHFISGDDHESWFAPGFNFGAYLMMLAKSQGREDLNYLGHVEADVELKCGKFSQVMKIQHPGGGSAYARSYKGQKMIESFQGGEKPAILIQGHFHLSGYSFDRNVHLVSMPGFQDQTIFGRKKHLRFEIGGCIIEFKMSATTGAITRFRPEFNMFFDRGFYRPYLKSDSYIIRGHMIIETGK